MKNLQYKSFKAQLSEDGNYVEGYASTYGNIDRVGDVVEKGAFAKTLETKNRSAPIRFLWQHDASRPIGTIVKHEDRPEGLWFRAKFSNTTAGRDAREDFLSGTVDRFSIGFVPVIQKREKRNGRMVNVIKEARLYEFSAVTFPANELAMMTAVKAADPKGELNETYRALLVQIADGFLLAQQMAAGTAEIDPETPAEGQVDPESTEDAPEAEDAAADAPEGEQGEEAAVEGEEAPEKAPADPEIAPEKPASDEEDEDEDEKKKSLEAAIQTFRMELALKRALGR